MVNKYAGRCANCNDVVDAKAGYCEKKYGRWVVRHVDCHLAAGSHAVGYRKSPRIVTTRFSSGAVVYRNSNGRCIDAPCCGCCS